MAGHPVPELAIPPLTLYTLPALSAAAEAGSGESALAAASSLTRLTALSAAAEAGSGGSALAAASSLDSHDESIRGSDLAILAALLAVAALILIAGTGAVIARAPAPAVERLGPARVEIAATVESPLPVLVARPVPDGAREVRRWFPDVPPIDLDLDDRE